MLPERYCFLLSHGVSLGDFSVGKACKTNYRRVRLGLSERGVERGTRQRFQIKMREKDTGGDNEILSREKRGRG